MLCESYPGVIACRMGSANSKADALSHVTDSVCAATLSLSQYSYKDLHCRIPPCILFSKHVWHQLIVHRAQSGINCHCIALAPTESNKWCTLSP